ncbi:hypothetical protein BN183_4060002 [Clostridioides difficile E7]|nr:hypothetical protein BN183_4060002 [Clostridioides difficile E7]
MKNYAMVMAFHKWTDFSDCLVTYQDTFITKICKRNRMFIR